ncbi:MAG: chorismate mutase [Pseudomonadota bacterium]
MTKISASPVARNTPDEVPAEACETMDEVRAGIDRLDCMLVALLAERQRYIEAAGRIKTDRNTVRLPWRIEDVVAKVLAQARAQGLSERIAEPVWRELIDRCIQHEDEIWAHAHLDKK